MRRRWIMALGAVAGVVSIWLLLSRATNSSQLAADAARSALKAEGFKTELKEFAFSAADPFRQRAAILLLPGAVERVALVREMPDLMKFASSNSVEVVWKLEALKDRSGEDVWQELRGFFGEHRALLDNAVAAALEGPIKFDLNAAAGSAMALPHVSALKYLTLSLGMRAIFELHSGNRDAAFTNLLAATRLLSAWQAEPVQICQMVRFSMASVLYNVTWQMLQDSDWSDDRLVMLQREWASLNFFRDLPETAAFQRACAVDACRSERMLPRGGGFSWAFLLRSPLSAWSVLANEWAQIRYRSRGTFEDERNLLLYYRDRELELRRAIQANCWVEMKQLPGVTNTVPFTSPYRSRFFAMMRGRQLALSAQNRELVFLGRASVAETQRRLVVCALALERYRRAHHAYPPSLRELETAILPIPAVDFMDGEPLHYRLGPDQKFLLYSVGLDGIDNNGELLARNRARIPELARIESGSDLVWPRPASGSEVGAQRKAELAAEEAAAKKAEIEAENQRLAREQLRRSTVETLLGSKAPPRLRQPTYRGQLLAKLLRNKRLPGAADPAIDELLTLSRVPAETSPEIVAFEVPIAYDAVTNLGSLHLLVDAPPGETGEGMGGESQECVRSSNGNCTLQWNTSFDPSGLHALQAQFTYEENEEEKEVKGPVVSFLSTNIIQFGPLDSVFSPKGAFFHGWLAQSNATYRIEIKSSAGEHIKTLTGATSNGVIAMKWDLIDEQGRPYTNESFQAEYHVDFH